MNPDEQSYVYELLRRLHLSDFGARTGEFLLRPLSIGLLLVGAWAISRLGGRAVRRTVRSVQERSPVRGGSVRAEQRFETIADVLARLVRVVVWSVTILVALGQLGINLAPLLAGAGVAGLAIGFGAQSLVKDVISGLFIVLEDQYGVGDVVTLGGASGTVEDLGLRATRLRADDGTVWFVPNGETRSVGNSSMEWSRALLDVVVANDSDLDRARALIKQEADLLAADPLWAEAVLEPPEIWGVQAVGSDGITLRLVVKTAPRQQFPVARELRGRISERLRREGLRGSGKSGPVTVGLHQGPSGTDAGLPPAAPPASEPDSSG